MLRLRNAERGARIDGAAAAGDSIDRRTHGSLVACKRWPASNGLLCRRTSRIRRRGREDATTGNRPYPRSPSSRCSTGRTHSQYKQYAPPEMIQAIHPIKQTAAKMFQSGSAQSCDVTPTSNARIGPIIRTVNKSDFRTNIATMPKTRKQLCPTHMSTNVGFSRTKASARTEPSNAFSRYDSTSPRASIQRIDRAPHNAATIVSAAICQ